jgi:hypothetical protein
MIMQLSKTAVLGVPISPVSGPVYFLAARPIPCRL